MHTLTDLLPNELQPYALEIIGGFAAAAGLLLLALVWRAFGRRKKSDGADDVPDFHLSVLAPAPPVDRPPLLFEGQPCRLRFVVMAPPGRNADLTLEMAEVILQSIFYGLGKVFRTESPHVQVWPPQLSQTGFAPIFFRRVARPEPPDIPSRWILLAGPAKAGTRTVLLGLALEVGEPSPRGNVRMKAEQWSDKLRVLAVG
jgi:hypothetical protein